MLPAPAWASPPQATALARAGLKRATPRPQWPAVGLVYAGVLQVWQAGRAGRLFWRATPRPGAGGSEVASTRSGPGAAVKTAKKAGWACF